MKKKNQWTIKDIETNKVSYFKVGANISRKSHTRFTNFVRGGLTVLISVLIIYGVVQAGTITPPSGTPEAQFYTLSEIYTRLTTNATTTEGRHSFAFADSLAGTGRTLTEIYNAVPTIDPTKLLNNTTYLGITGTIATQTLSADSDTVNAGYYAATTLSAEDIDLAVENIKSGTTIFGVEGTLTSGPVYSKQSLVEKDDAADGDAEGEEAGWTETNTTDHVWKDGRTGLYWSSSQGKADNNNFTISTCSFFSTEPRGDYNGLDGDCGDDPEPYNLNAINICGLLSLDADANEAGGDEIDEDDWYLPSQKELQQAYIDGMYNQAGLTFTKSYCFWSCTETSSTSEGAWSERLDNGCTYDYAKISNWVYVRCVRR